uniref:Uncharacterized protein n=1 Tax=Anguilla anguilla TaxID=7936 RepID=A0A0E9UES9_ANGAN
MREGPKTVLKPAFLRRLRNILAEP